MLLDIYLPVSVNSQMLSWKNLGIRIKKEYPAIKIIILTVLEDPFRLQNILSNVNPDGFLLKGETTSKELGIDLIHLAIFLLSFSVDIGRAHH